MSSKQGGLREAIISGISSYISSRPEVIARQTQKQSIAAAYAHIQLVNKRKKAASTNLTGPLGITTPAQTTQATLGT